MLLDMGMSTRVSCAFGRVNYKLRFDLPCLNLWKCAAGFVGIGAWSGISCLAACLDNTEYAHVSLCAGRLCYWIASSGRSGRAVGL